MTRIKTSRKCRQRSTKCYIAAEPTAILNRVSTGPRLVLVPFILISRIRALCAAMKRKKFSWFIFCTGALLFCSCGDVTGSPAAEVTAGHYPNNIAVNKFQAALQQQNFYTILSAIEERLGNLDHIYSMQPSQILETKLDQCNRRMESLDTKIIRLEALVMLNLDRISENISTKNFKDDVSWTNAMRKIDSVYEGICHRLNYIDRKFDTKFVNIQSKMDSMLTQLEKIQENMATRDSGIEAELSDAIFAIDDLKTTSNVMEGKLLNITSYTLNITKDTYNLLKTVNMDNKNALNKLHDNIVENLEYMDKKSVVLIKATNEHNDMLKTMKMELKEDFNDYANKVADMNSYIWKNSDTTGLDLRTIATVLNSTKIEVQNGIRALMLQIGKLVNKNSSTPLVLGSNSLTDISQKLTTNFEKILSNQDLFLESCHRVQMDESQIESEISGMLEKLIDMLEQKMASETKDIKSIEKALKSHDGKMNRNMHQANTNINSLYEKSTMNDQELKIEMKKIGNVLEALFAFVQSKTRATPSIEATSITVNMELILDKLERIETFARRLDLRIANISKSNNCCLDKEIKRKIDSVFSLLRSVKQQVNQGFSQQDLDKIFSSILSRHFDKINSYNGTKGIDNGKLDDDTKKTIVEIFGSNPDLVQTDRTKYNNTKTGDDRQLEVFGSNPDLIQVSDTEYNNTKSTDDGELDNDTKKAIMEIFGSNSDYVQIKAPDSESVEVNENEEQGKSRNSRPYDIDIRSSFNASEGTEYKDEDEDIETTMHSLDIFIDEVDTTTEAGSVTDESIIDNFLETKGNDITD